MSANNLKTSSASLEWQKEQGIKSTTAGASLTSSGTTEAAPYAKMIVAVTIVQGRGLVAKDKNVLGQKTSSDPYVKLYLSTVPKATQFTRGEKTKIGKTPVVKKNLNPTWDTTFDAFDVPYGAKGDDSVTLVFEIYDEDKASADDAMGIVKIPLPFKDTETEAVWYEVPYNSTKDASGEIQVKIKTTLVASS